MTLPSVDGVLAANVVNGRADVTELIKSKAGISLDIGCGAHKIPGANVVGMDFQKLPGVDVVHNWYKYPWPFPDECATFAHASHVIEHVSPIDFERHDTFGVFRWMDEVWRILRPGAQFKLTYPNGSSPRYVQDPTHVNQWNEVTPWYFCVEHPFYDIYTPKPWRMAYSEHAGPAVFWDSHLGDVEVLLIKLGEDEIHEWKWHPESD
jgi:hypothetical protein